ncbi:hypothetical protein [Kitasatospora sp. NPDC094015]|uniref:hypothetical protein n=1 Tax=Kitasatospora sp. NPDC094015 TaxID=3155205 RepID=UPI00332197ED
MRTAVDAPWWTGPLRHARAHDLAPVALLLAVVAGCEAAFGSLTLSFPLQHAAHSAGFPMRRELPIAYAALTAGSLHSRMADLETAAAAVLARYEGLQLAAMYAATVLLVGGVELSVSGPGTAVVLVRALLVWTGLALVSGRVFGPRLAWILPVATVFPLTYLGEDGQGRALWWDWTVRPPSDAAGWTLAAVTTAAGLTAFRLTPWRLRTLRGRLAAR